MSEKRNLVHWSILALRNCRTTLCVAAFNTFSSADGDFANFGGKFLPPIPTKTGQGRMDGNSSKNFSGSLGFPDNKAFGKLRFACFVGVI